MASEQQQTSTVRQAPAVGRWFVAAVLCLVVAVYAWHEHAVLERRVATLEATVAFLQQRSSAGSVPVGLDQLPLRNKRDATSGQCLCPPGKRSFTVWILHSYNIMWLCSNVDIIIVVIILS
ncbi:collagen alpha chain [Aphis craccivora]|uniref:Collagen alpha chain n=1 Tax=Aphis craccivora TaxID=307492 RepID=A0A6G0ZR97_APHCR|nr:collagen alpha chain [Aphis craccivora]